MKPLAKNSIPIRQGLFRLDPDERLKLIGSHCITCGKMYFPRKTICPYCLEDKSLEIIEFQGKGKIYSFAVIWQGPKGFTVPYATLYVDMPEGVRIFGLGFPEDFTNGFEIGLEVQVKEVIFRANENGVSIMDFKFIPKRG